MTGSFSAFVCNRIRAAYVHRAETTGVCREVAWKKAKRCLRALEREMIEETAIKPVVGNLLYIQQFTHSGVEYLEFFFHITNSEDYLNIDLTKTSHGEKELAEISFVDPKSVRLLPEFLSTEPLNEAVASAEPVRIFSLL